MKPIFSVSPGEFLIYKDELYKKVGHTGTGIIQNQTTRKIQHIPTMTKVKVLSEKEADEYKSSKK